MLKKRLFQMAFLSSPILGVYGVLPIYLLNNWPLALALSAVFGLTIIFFGFWCINIFLLIHFKNNAQKRYSLSFTLTILLHSIVFLFANTRPASPELNFLYPLIFITFINSIILIICNYVQLRYDKEISDLAYKELEVNNLEAQKQVLMQQLQPHFLFNALSILKSLIQENAEEAEFYTVKLSEFLRYSIKAQNGELVTLQEEMKFTQDYLDLQLKRFNEALLCKVDIPQHLLQKRIPVYAVQTLVENALKHNRFSEEEPLIIKLGVENELLKVWNNKQPKMTSSAAGIGLSNLNMRYQLIAGKALEIVDSKLAFCVSIPLI
jgi:two-component system, LytTR family, sensor kinase